MLIVILLLIITIIAVLKNNGRMAPQGKKIVILGVDGMDPQLVAEGIDKKMLPNLLKLKSMGYYSELQTTTPPQSPVAWASFATGMNPSNHGIYDFIVRKPENYQLDLVWMNSLDSAIKTKTFWEEASKLNIETSILFLPNTFPPGKLNGRMISGMGTPDILGTAGKFSFFTTREVNKKSRGNQIHIINSDVQTVDIPGPKYQLFQETKTSTLPLQIERNKTKKQVILTVGNKKILIKESEFSDWVPLQFKIDFFTRINGIAKFYLKQTTPELELYLSPINFDPSQPIKDISFPQSYSKDLAKEYGLFYTQGLPHDTWALEEGIFDDKAFLKNADAILEERERIYFGELKKQKSGIFFSYFGITDTVSHMFWDQPEVILEYYKKIDDVIGKTMSQLKKDDVLIVMSDHGFAGFDWEFNLNSWLHDNGYLTLLDGADQGGELLGNIDWENTKAYAIGYNGIYINKKGREGQGIVDEKESQLLEKKIKSELLEVANPSTDSLVVKNIYSKTDLNINKIDLNSPDLFVGYYKGIRSSWDTAVGATPKNIFNKRNSKWSGDHLFDASEVPGILFSNVDLHLKAPQITNIAPLVLKLIKDIKK